MVETLTKPVYELLVPVKQQSTLVAKYTLLEYDAESHAYVPFETGTPCAILMEEVPAGTGTKYAKAAFEGTFFADEIGNVPEDVRAALRNVKIYVLDRATISR